MSIATHVASLRKANEVNHPRPNVSTPAEFSRLKFEREVKYQEKSEQYRQQMIAQQKVRLILCEKVNSVFANINCL